MRAALDTCRLSEVKAGSFLVHAARARPSVCARAQLLKLGLIGRSQAPLCSKLTLDLGAFGGSFCL
jgi:hypothetical protein